MVFLNQCVFMAYFTDSRSVKQDIPEHSEIEGLVTVFKKAVPGPCFEPVKSSQLLCNLHPF